MSFEEFLEQELNVVGAEDCSSIDELEEALALVTDTSLNEAIEMYNKYCADNCEMLDTPDYLDSLFE